MNNLVVVYAPNGEKFEVTRLNAHDLTTHAGWSFNPPADGAKAPAPEPEEDTEIEDEQSGTTGEGSGEDDAEEADADEEGEEADEEAEDEVASDEDEETAFTSADAFENMDRDAVVAYLAEHFPDFKPHHLAKRETLIDKAIELASA